ncbi:hypothetical protein KTE26_14170 [Ralstonia mannitolilytica]|uniref:hypothetical protein n=1 Tax=Ralstonia mannitolilytica TaxID=105219 RepID=UPI001C22338A|nr:hypothetical protein [Ralstonia mannitolilytica]MBU9579576.1 hypothetical protein [Ralstonia mannitolilytica]
MKLSKIEFIADWQRVMGSDTALSTDTVLEYINLRAQADARPVAWYDRATGNVYPLLGEGERYAAGVRQLEPLYTHPEASAPGLSTIIRSLERSHTGMCYGDEKRGSITEYTRGFGECIKGLKRALENARASAATVAEPGTDNVWPIVNITVSESGEVTAAKLYAPGLPAGNHDVYPVRVPYMDEHTEAWMAVANALKEVAPGYLDGSGNGIECAVKAIHRLAAQQQAEPGADERAAFMSKMDALDLKEFRELTGCHSPADYRMKLEDLHGGEESLATEYLQDKVFEDMRQMYKTMGEFDNKAVDRFAKAMKRKMAASRKKGRSGWDDPEQCSPERLAQMLIDHLAKGDPVDVGNFAMMLFNRPDTVGALARAAQSGQRAGVAEDAAVRDVIAERIRQVTHEGWTVDHDDAHDKGEMAEAAACYAREAATPHAGLPNGWPWSRRWWKPTTPRRMLVKAGALILAEIERLDRAAPTQQQEGA